MTTTVKSVYAYELEDGWHLAYDEIFNSYQIALTEYDNTFQHIESPEDTYIVIPYVQYLKSVHNRLMEYGCPHCKSGDQLILGDTWETMTYGCTCGAEWTFEVEYKLVKYTEGKEQ